MSMIDRLIKLDDFLQANPDGRYMIKDKQGTQKILNAEQLLEHATKGDISYLSYPPIGGEEGSRRVQTLNVVNAAKADEYQLGAGSDTDPPPKDPAEDGEPKTPGEGEGEE